MRQLVPVLLLLIACEDTIIQKAPPPCIGDTHFDLINRACDYRGELAQSSTGTCNLGSFKCVEGTVLCLNAGEPSPESCDLKDNDCNGVIDDEDAFDISFCYDGDPKTILYPPCRPGLLLCRGGEITCYHEILPGPEVPNNCVDDDCNGIVDDTPENQTIDVALLIDRSGSMAEYMPQIQSAVARLRSIPNIHVWMLDLPSAKDPHWAFNPDCHVVTSTNTPTPPCRPDDLIMAANNLDANYGSIELSYDALLSIFVGETQFAWTEGADRLVIFFGDEDGQSLNGTTQAEIVAARGDYQFRAFVSPLWVGDYSQIGIVYTLDLIDLPQFFPGAIACP